jgi:hypothetical protein
MPNRSIAGNYPPLVYKVTTTPRPAVYEVSDGALSRATLHSIRADLRRQERLAIARGDLISLGAANAAIAGVDKQLLKRRGAHVR